LLCLPTNNEIALCVDIATLKYCSAQDARVATFRSYAVGGQ
jgi:hypothetical protein